MTEQSPAVDYRQFTPTQQAMLKVLSDGMPHTREELHACLPDNLGALSNIRAHIANIRKALRPIGQDVVCELFRGTIHYRQIRLLASPYDGRT